VLPFPRRQQGRVALDESRRLCQQVFDIGNPNARRLVGNGGDDLRAVGTVRRRPDNGVVAAELAEFLAGGRIPDARRTVVTGGDDLRAVGTVRRRPDKGGVAAELASSWPVAASQMRAVWSSLAVTICAPSGL